MRAAYDSDHITIAFVADASVGDFGPGTPVTVEPVNAAIDRLSICGVPLTAADLATMKPALVAALHDLADNCEWEE
jgi:hypothetical protein